MNTKIVTSYYGKHSGEPFAGKVEGRTRSYKYSLISICNTGVPVVCYTDDHNGCYDELVQFKEEKQLDNLTIKKYDLTTSSYHQQILNIRTNNPDYDPEWRIPVLIYWMKWVFVKMEYEPDTYIYWIDAGLATSQLIPKRLAQYGNEEGFSTGYLDETGAPDWDQEYKFYQFPALYNPEFITKINNYSEDKIVLVCRDGITDCEFYKFYENIDLPHTNIMGINKYPIGGFFGGNTPHLLDYCDAFHNLAEHILNTPAQTYLCPDQELMGHILGDQPEWFKLFVFDTFYHEDWNVWEEIYTPELRPFHNFFTTI
jgi:hypothetical protein